MLTKKTKHNQNPLKRTTTKNNLFLQLYQKSVQLDPITKNIQIKNPNQVGVIYARGKLIVNLM